MTEEYKRLIQFAIRNTIKYEMLNQRMGDWNEVLKNEEFSCGFYKLCDLIGEEYVKS